MSEIHIKPCPFCGSENISFNAFSISSDAYVLCEQCNASIEISVPWDGMDEKEHDKVCFEKLLVLWNKRASERTQSELNENQQTVLDWLKESCKLNGLSTVIEIMGFLPTTGGKMKYKQIAYAYGDLNDDELAQVLQSFSQWVWEQEEK
ncbi:Lar family restriction alleviation protein [Enterococcus faecalis]|uniref:Lar family restriction alleviation protein n=1 Tax=Enterococcus faecalis TaxID=1351 RepID=UPI001F5744FB|nr:Lar family restriction alleviation protein [Enterococcus faecalis]